MYKHKDHFVTFDIVHIFFPSSKKDFSPIDVKSLVDYLL